MPRSISRKSFVKPALLGAAASASARSVPKSALPCWRRFGHRLQCHQGGRL
jgi:hypothetical protein